MPDKHTSGSPSATGSGQRHTPIVSQDGSGIPGMAYASMRALSPASLSGNTSRTSTRRRRPSAHPSRSMRRSAQFRRAIPINPLKQCIVHPELAARSHPDAECDARTDQTRAERQWLSMGRLRRFVLSGRMPVLSFPPTELLSLGPGGLPSLSSGHGPTAPDQNPGDSMFSIEPDEVDRMLGVGHMTQRGLVWKVLLRIPKLTHDQISAYRDFAAHPPAHKVIAQDALRALARLSSWKRLVSKHQIMRVINAFSQFYRWQYRRRAHHRAQDVSRHSPATHTAADAQRSPLDSSSPMHPSKQRGHGSSHASPGGGPQAAGAVLFTQIMHRQGKLPRNLQEVTAPAKLTLSAAEASNDRDPFDGSSNGFGFGAEDGGGGGGGGFGTSSGSAELGELSDRAGCGHPAMSPRTGRSGSSVLTGSLCTAGAGGDLDAPAKQAHAGPHLLTLSMARAGGLPPSLIDAGAGAANTPLTLPVHGHAAFGPTGSGPTVGAASRSPSDGEFNGEGPDSADDIGERASGHAQAGLGMQLLTQSMIREGRVPSAVGKPAGGGSHDLVMPSTGGSQALDDLSDDDDSGLSQLSDDDDGKARPNASVFGAASASASPAHAFSRLQPPYVSRSRLSGISGHSRDSRSRAVTKISTSNTVESMYPLIGRRKALECGDPVPIGYVQGIARIAATLLLTMPEPDAFYCLVRIVFNLMPSYYHENYMGSMAACDLSYVVLHLADPELARHLQSSDVTPERFSSSLQSILTQAQDYTKDFYDPVPHILQLWDLLLTVGFSLLPVVYAAQLISLRAQLLSAEPGKLPSLFNTPPPFLIHGVVHTFFTIYPLVIKNPGLEALLRETPFIREARHVSAYPEDIQRLAYGWRPELAAAEPIHRVAVDSLRYKGMAKTQHNPPGMSLDPLPQVLGLKGDQHAEGRSDGTAWGMPPVREGNDSQKASSVSPVPNTPKLLRKASRSRGKLPGSDGQSSSLQAGPVMFGRGSVAQLEAMQRGHQYAASATLPLRLPESGTSDTESSSSI